jgi:hypothetical protein
MQPCMAPVHEPATALHAVWAMHGTCVEGRMPPFRPLLPSLIHPLTHSNTHTPAGHTSAIYASQFLPDTGNSQIATCSADRQVRIVDLERLAVKPFVSHRSRVKSLAAISTQVILSGGEGELAGSRWLIARAALLRDPAAALTRMGARRWHREAVGRA